MQIKGECSSSEKGSSCEQQCGRHQSDQQKAESREQNANNQEKLQGESHEKGQEIPEIIQKEFLQKSWKIDFSPKGETWIDFSDKGSILILNWRALARSFGLPKTTKRIEKKRIKKIINEALSLLRKSLEK